MACIFAGCVCLPDVFTLPVWNRPPGLVGTAGFCGFWRDWEGVFVWGGRKCREWSAGLGIWKAELFWEGVFVLGGWNGWVVD
ncbi:MAG: hypothetical protein ACLR7M_07225 [Varibaculum timonense]